MITLAPFHLEAIEASAECAYPREACGLLLGREERTAGGRHVVVTAVVASANVADDPTRRFEVDPSIRLRVERNRAAGGDALVGLYHSHPDGEPRPSAQDLASVWEPDLAWLITTVERGKATHTTGHFIVGAAAARFVEVPVHAGHPAG